jgi:fatty-acyl-CoA synthase
MPRRRAGCAPATSRPWIREFCKGQIAHYKIPRYIEFVAEFPMTITGKSQKFVMREQTIEKLGLKAEKTA